MIKVKICGITNLGDALAAVDAGADALGFVFYKKSPRYITPQKAKNIVRGLSERIVKVGVFVNQSERVVRSIAELCRLDMLQFHGSESPGFCAKFKEYKIIKAFRIRNSVDFESIFKYKTFAYLFDTFVRMKAGGTGRQFDWKLVEGIADRKRVIFLSGGITETNVQEAISIVRPGWIDVSSSLEIGPGRKDREKIKQFIKAAKK